MSGPWIVWDIPPDESRGAYVIAANTDHLNCIEERGYNGETVKLPAHRAGLLGNGDMIVGPAFLPACKARHPADLPVNPPISGLNHG
jgi:hypothetical protein